MCAPSSGQWCAIWAQTRADERPTPEVPRPGPPPGQPKSVLFNPKICEFVSAVPINTLLHIKGNLLHNSHNKRTEVFVRELRRLSHE